jgi:hypothetical protein
MGCHSRQCPTFSAKSVCAAARAEVVPTGHDRRAVPGRAGNRDKQAARACRAAVKVRRGIRRHASAGCWEPMLETSAESDILRIDSGGDDRCSTPCSARVV